MKPLKTFLVILAACYLSAATTRGQGTITLQNSALQRVTVDSFGPVPAGSPIVYGVFWGTSPDDLTLNEGPLGTASTTIAGVITAQNGSVYPIIGTESDQTVYLKVAGWSSAFGRDWESAMRSPGSYYGETTIIQCRLGYSAGPGTVIWQSASGTNPSRFRPLTLYEVPGLIRLSFGYPSGIAMENSGQVQVSIRCLGGHQEPISVEWFTMDGTAMAGSDYIGGSETVTFAVGEIEKVVTIPILNDRNFEPSESFFVYLRNLTGGSVLGEPNHVTIQILDNDRGIYFEQPSYSVSEAETAVDLVVRREVDVPGDVSVEWNTLDDGAVAGRDYLASTGLLTFAGGETQKSIRVLLINDGWHESTESFSIRLSNPSGEAALGSPSQANIQIDDNDRGVFFDITSITVTENAGVVPILIRREADVLEPVSVDWFTTNGTARAGEDYAESRGTVSFGAGELEKSVSIPLINDGRPENAETFRVSLADPPGGGLGVPSEVTIQIDDNDRGLSFHGTPFVATENAGTLRMVVRRESDVLTPVSVEWFTTNGAARAGEDYVRGAGSLAFGSGEVAKTLEIAILNDSSTESGEVFRVTLANPSGDTGLGTPSEVTVQILDDDPAATRYVWLESPNPTPPYDTWATAAHDIQTAADAAWPGDLVLVTNGLYQTGSTAVGDFGLNRVALIKAVNVRSVNGPNVTTIVGAAAVQDDIGSPAIRCVYVGSSATLEGFALTGGQSDSGGGAWCADGARLVNCIITDNEATWSGGGAYAEWNWGGEGAVIERCLILRNHASWEGGGVQGGILRNCILAENSARFSGGAFESALHNCVVVGNSATNVGGGVGSLAMLYNCTVTRNTATEAAGGVWNVDAVYNSIVYDNRAPVGANYEGERFAYSCTTPLPTGPGNIDADPRFDDLWRLPVDSPCRAVGNLVYSSGVDIDGQAWASTPSMGADEPSQENATGSITLQFFPPRTRVAVLYPVEFQGYVIGSGAKHVWDFGDGTQVTNRASVRHAWLNPGPYVVRLTAYNESHPEGISVTSEVEVIHAIHYVNAVNPTPVPPYTNWATAATNIQEAIDVDSTLGRTVVVTNGVYQPITLDRDIILQSIRGPAFTIIDGEGLNRCAYISNSATLSGFTLTNGYGWGGGGVYSEYDGRVTNCVLLGNVAVGWRGSGRGGAAYGGTLDHCVLAGNSAGHGGGAADSVLRSCVLTGNNAWGGGGAAIASRLYNCALYGNSAALGGAASTYWAGECILENCTVIGNSATDAGGGVYGGTINNCIVALNQAPVGANYYSDESAPLFIEHSCTSPLPTNGMGNIDADPRFENVAASDYRLRPGSPCIDTGTNFSGMVVSDLAGLPRSLDGDGDGVPRPDMGAYEFNPYRFAPSLTFSPDGFQFTVRGEPGKSVIIERSRDLIHWEFAGQVPIPASGQTLIDPLATTERQLFYRVMSVP